MNELYEALKGFTDVPLAILSLIFGILCYKKMKSKSWSTLFFIIACAAVLGAFVHSIELPLLGRNLVWAVLYPFLFEAVRRFGVCFGAFIDKNEKPSSPAIFVLEAILYVCELLVMFCKIPLNDILVFAAFAVVIFIQTTIRVVRAAALPKIAVIFLCLLAVPLLLQICESFIPYAVVIEHTFLAVEFYIAYRIALKTEKE